MAASTDLYSNTNQTCLDSFGSELMEALKPFMICDDSPSSRNWFQPEPSHHDLVWYPCSEDTDPALVGGDYQSTCVQDEYWLGPFTSKELEQLEASFRQPTTQQALEVEIDSQSNVNVATSAIDSQKNKAIERIVKDYGITRQILEQHFGMTLQNAAKSLHVSPSTLKRIRDAYGISRWPHHKTRKVYQHVSQDMSLQGVENQLCSHLSQEKGARSFGLQNILSYRKTL